MEKAYYGQEWDAAYNSGMTLWYPAECVIRFFAKNLRKQVDVDEYKDLKPIRTVLDIGCGNGGNVLYFNKLGYEACGVDISQVAVNIGNRLLKSHGFPETIICADMEDAEFPDNHFDAVVSHAALDHITTDKFNTVLKKINRILKPGGYLFITLRGMEGFDYEKNTATEIEPHTLITAEAKELDSPFENPHEKNIPQHFFSYEEIMASLTHFDVFDIYQTVTKGGKNFMHEDARWYVAGVLKNKIVP